jgi:hypothetical protein
MQITSGCFLFVILSFIKYNIIFNSNTLCQQHEAITLSVYNSVSLYAAFRPSWTRQQGFAVGICNR